MATSNHQPSIETSNPDFDAFPLTALDREVLSTADSDFVPHSWSEIRSLILHNRLEAFKRRPADLRRYLAWSQSVKVSHGSITNYVLKERLHWTPKDKDFSPPKFDVRNPTPFKDDRDYAVLRNDWPYGLEDGIKHLIVWLKTPLEVDTDSGDLTVHARGLVDKFVEKTFVRKLDALSGADHGRECVAWFKNWVALQSVRGVDHVHVLVRDVPDAVIQEWCE